MPKLRPLLALSLATGLLAAACGGSSPQGSSGGTGKITVRIASSVPQLSFAPLLVAQHKGFFAQQGVDLQATQLQNGAGTAQQALVGGSIDVLDVGSLAIAIPASKGSPIQAIEGTAKMTTEVCANKKWMDNRGVTPGSPLKQRLAAFKGATLGVTGPASADFDSFRWLLKRYGGLNPDTDVTLTAVGGADSLAGAIEQSKIQGFMVSPPSCEEAAKQGAAEVLIKPGEIKEFSQLIWEVMVTTQPYMQSHKDAVTKVATAVAMGNNYILAHPQESIQLLQKDFSKTDPDIISNAAKDVVFPQVPKDGKMTSGMWNNVSSVLTESGAINQPLDTSEGKIWTNKSIGNPAVS